MSTRAVDPRIRERWVAVRRAEGRRRQRILLVLLAVALVGTAAWVALATCSGVVCTVPRTMM